LRHNQENFKTRSKTLEAKVANDGIILGHAQDAIQLFQQKEELAVDGMPTRPLLKALRTVN